MADLSDEEFLRLMRAFEARGYTVLKKEDAEAAAATTTTPKVLLEEKYFRRIEKFSGEAAKWQEWLFGVCVAVGAVSSACVLAMEEVIRQAGGVRDVAKMEEVISERMKIKFGAELFGVLCSLTSGEANVVVRSVVQKGAGYCGFAALCVLSQRFNPKTPARILQFLTTILNPTPIKDVRLLERAVEEWEIKVGKLKVEFDEEFSDTIKVAIITGMIPRDLQDMVFQMGKSGEVLKYREVRDKVMSIASHRAQMATPTPMEVGWVGEPTGEEHSAEYWDYDQEQGIDAVGKATSCYRCGGWGHLARQCPTPEEAKGSKGKGMSKGAAHKGGGKGISKGGPKGGVWGKGVPGFAKGVVTKGTSKGVGYQGTCWNCGLVGHKAAECNQMQIGEVAEATPEPREVASVGGVWSISQVRSIVQAGRQSDEAAKRPVARCDAEVAFRPMSKEKVAASYEKQISNAPRPPGLQGEWRVVAGRWRNEGVQKKRKELEVTGGRFRALDICPLGVEENQNDVEAEVCGVATAVTVDSAAEESVCPRGWAGHFGTDPVLNGKELKLVNASGGKITHYGTRKVAMQADGRLLGMNFEVTDVKKPLLAVTRICERGNLVQFGPEAAHNFIQHIDTGEKLYMKRRGNSYVLPGELAETNPF